MLFANMVPATFNLPLFLFASTFVVWLATSCNFVVSSVHGAFVSSCFVAAMVLLRCLQPNDSGKRVLFFSPFRSEMAQLFLLAHLRRFLLAAVAPLVRPIVLSRKNVATHDHRPTRLQSRDMSLGGALFANYMYRILFSAQRPLMTD